MTIPTRAAEGVTWPEGCPVPVYRDTGTMVQALVLQRRLPWQGNSYEEIGPATAPLRSFHDRCFVAGQEPSVILFNIPSL